MLFKKVKIRFTLLPGRSHKSIQTLRCLPVSPDTSAFITSWLQTMIDEILIVTNGRDASGAAPGAWLGASSVTAPCYPAWGFRGS